MDNNDEIDFGFNVKDEVKNIDIKRKEKKEDNDTNHFGIGDKYVQENIDKIDYSVDDDDSDLIIDKKNLKRRNILEDTSILIKILYIFLLITFISSAITAGMFGIYIIPLLILTAVYFPIFWLFYKVTCWDSKRKYRYECP